MRVGDEVAGRAVGEPPALEAARAAAGDRVRAELVPGGVPEHGAPVVRQREEAAVQVLAAGRRAGEGVVGAVGDRRGRAVRGDDPGDARQQSDHDGHGKCDAQALRHPDSPGERRIGGRDERLQEPQHGELDGEPVAGVRRRRDRRRPVGERRRARCEPDRERRQRHEDEQPGEEPLAPGAVEHRDDEPGEERSPRPSAVGVVERRQNRDERDRGEHAQDGDPAGDRDAEGEQSGDAREDPECVPVADRDEQAVAGVGVERPEMPRIQARCERVEADRGRAEHEARQPAFQVATAQHQERSGDGGRIDDGALSLVDRGAGRSRPDRRAERDHAERGACDGPRGVEPTPAWSGEHRRDDRHPGEGERCPAEGGREEAAVRRGDGDDRCERQQERERGPEWKRAAFHPRCVREGMARHSAVLHDRSASAPAAPRSSSGLSSASRSVCSARWSATSTVFVFTSRTSPI